MAILNHNPTTASPNSGFIKSVDNLLYFSHKYCKKIIRTHFIATLGWLLLALPTQAQNADIRLLRSINHNRPKALDIPMLRVSQSVAPLAFGTALTQGIVGLAKHDNATLLNGLETGASVGGQTLISLILKETIRRPRPYVTYPDIERIGSDFTPSFPSGHTGTAFALATSLTLQYPEWYVAAPAYTYAALVGYSRMHLGAHYPSDVLAGAVLGTGMAFGMHYLRRALPTDKAKLSLGGVGLGSGIGFALFYTIKKTKDPEPGSDLGMRRHGLFNFAYRTRSHAPSPGPPNPL